MLAASAGALVLALVPLLLAGCGAAGTVATDTIDQHVESTATPHISVSTFGGRISIVTGVDSGIDVHVIERGSGADQTAAQAELGHISVSIHPAPGGLTIQVRTDSTTPAAASGVDLELTVPSAATLDLATSNGSIESANVTGVVTALASNGAITVRGASGVHAQTTNAAVTIVKSSGELVLGTSEGAIDVVDADHAVVTAQTSHGTITFSGTLAPGTTSLTTANAAIDVSLPADAAFIFESFSTNSTMTNDFDLTQHDGFFMTGTVGTDPLVHIQAETSNGSIRVSKLVP